VNRRSSSPSIPIPPGQSHGARRAGSRHESTERIRLRADGREITGWTLNVSRGGARLVLEESADLGEVYELVIGDQLEARDVKTVWAQDEADGQIVGVQFLDVEGSVPPASLPAAQQPGGDLPKGK